MSTISKFPNTIPILGLTHRKFLENFRGLKPAIKAAILSITSKTKLNKDNFCIKSYLVPFPLVRK